MPRFPLALLAATVVACGDAGPPLQVTPPLSQAARATSPLIVRTELGTLGGGASYATDINNEETVVGWSKTDAGEDRAFRWTAATGMVALPLAPGHTWSRAVAITPGGRILGYGGGRRVEPVLWTRTGEVQVIPIPRPPGLHSHVPVDFNDRGEVAGWAHVDNGFPDAWVWSHAGGYVDLTSLLVGAAETYASGINESGMVVGSITDCNAYCAYRGFTWDRVRGIERLGLPPGAAPAAPLFAVAVNGGGDVAGYVGIRSDAEVQPYRWSRSGGFRAYPVLSPGDWSYGAAVGINLAGTLVGGSYDAASDAIRATVWPESGGIIPLSPEDPSSSSAAAINDGGVVAGWVGGRAVIWRAGPGVRAVLPDTTPSASARRAPGPAARAAGACLTDPKLARPRVALIECLAAAGN